MLDDLQDVARGEGHMSALRALCAQVVVVEPTVELGQRWAL